MLYLNTSYAKLFDGYSFTTGCDMGTSESALSRGQGFVMLPTGITKLYIKLKAYIISDSTYYNSYYFPVSLYTKGNVYHGDMEINVAGSTKYQLVYVGNANGATTASGNVNVTTKTWHTFLIEADSVTGQFKVYVDKKENCLICTNASSSKTEFEKIRFRDYSMNNSSYYFFMKDIIVSDEELTFEHEVGQIELGLKVNNGFTVTDGVYSTETKGAEVVFEPKGSIQKEHRMVGSVVISNLAKSGEAVGSIEIKNSKAASILTLPGSNAYIMSENMGDELSDVTITAK